MEARFPEESPEFRFLEEPGALEGEVEFHRGDELRAGVPSPPRRGHQTFREDENSVRREGCPDVPEQHFLFFHSIEDLAEVGEVEGGLAERVPAIPDTEANPPAASLCPPGRDPDRCSIRVDPDE